MKRHVRRFEVAEESMEPTLSAGDFLVAVTEDRPRPGDLVVFDHPSRPGFRLVKRVTAIDERRMTVMSDNAQATLADSRTFGTVPIAGVYRVIARYWPPRTITLFSRR